MKKWAILAITACIAISLIAFIQATNMDKVIDSVQKVGYNFGWLILVTGIAYYFGTRSWQYCLGDQNKAISTRKLFQIRHICETVSLFNPTSVLGGDALKAGMLGKCGIENKRVIASIILSRFILIGSHLVFFLATALALLVQQSGFTNTGPIENVSGWLSIFIPKTKIFRLKTVNLLKEVAAYYKENKRAVTWSIGYALLHWLFGAFEFYFILKFLGIEVSILQALFIDLGVVYFKALGAFIPGQIGIEEYGNKMMLLAIGIPDAEIWISASILRRARQLVWIAFGILISVLFIKGSKQTQKE